MTVRNIYYQDPALFGKQAVVDRYVDALAYTFSLQRADLNVVSIEGVTLHGSSDIGSQTAVAKGLVAGVTIVEQTDGTSARWGDDGNVHRKLSRVHHY